MDGLFNTLDRDWHQLLLARRTRQHFDRWKDQDSSFDAYQALADLMAVLRSQATPGEADRLLAVLASRAGDDDLAARTVLQAILPGLRSLAAAHHWIAPADELEASLVAVAWHHIRNYPIVKRPRRIAANLILDTGHHLRRDTPRALTTSDTNAIGSAETAEPPPCEELTQLVVHSVAQGNLRPEAASLIIQTRVLDRPLAAIAQDLGYPPDTIRHRRRRAERSLKATA